jgi:hypothetical protein
MRSNELPFVARLSCWENVHTGPVIVSLLRATDTCAPINLVQR